MKKRSLLLLSLLFLLGSCQRNAPRECVLDEVVHLEDSIHYRIDSLPPLCTELGIEGEWVDIGDCRLYCEVRGQGVPLVLVNGGPGGTHHYFHPWFSAAEKNCRVIYYDQRGCGRSDFEPGEGYSFLQAVGDLEKLRQKLGIEKWVVCGYSYGGALAQFYTTQYPESVLGLVLIGAAPLFNDPLLDETRQYDFIAPVEQRRIDSLYGLALDGKLTLLQLLYNKDLNGDWKRQNFYKPTPDELIRSALYEWVNDRGFNATVGSDYGRYELRDVFASNPIPTLLCEGKWDLTWLPDKADLLRLSHPHAKFVLFKGAGHSIFSEEPDRFFPLLDRFVAGLKAVPPEKVEAWKQQAAATIDPQVALFRSEDRFVQLAQTQGAEKARDYYRAHKRAGEQLFTEPGMNALGYEFVAAEDLPSALVIFALNADAYPSSANVYDSWGETLLAAGQRAEAEQRYRQALEIDPSLESAREALAKFGQEK